MKHIFYTSLLIFLFNSCSGTSQNKVPKAVKQTFKNKYPGENDPDWHVDKNGFFESSFKKKGIHYRADFNKDGTWIETEQSIDKKELPKAIKVYLKKNHDGVKIYEIEKVSHHQKGVFYDVELKINGKKKDIEFLENGTIIN